MAPRASHLAAAVLVAALGFHAAPASAQFSYSSENDRAAHKRDAEQKEKPDQKPEEGAAAKYPNAKRQAPDLAATKKGAKALNEVVSDFNARNYPGALAKAESFAASASNDYEKASAYQLAGAAAANSNDMAKAEADFRKAVELNALDNDQHYDAMKNLAIVQYQLGHYQDAQKTLDRFLAESGADPAETANLRAAILSSTGQGGTEAAELFAQAWRKDPSNTNALYNAAVSYQQAKQFDKANALLMEAKAKGGLDSQAYRVLYLGQLQAGKDKDALATIQEGVANGKIAQDGKLSDAYVILAQDAYGAGDTAQAVAMYRKAIPLASDGEPALNLARVLSNEGRLAEARQAAQQALDKGLKDPADAKKILAKKGK
ncbi:MAG: tetratricopeptide repeat protein [Lysobacteraceae bacterium]